MVSKYWTFTYVPGGNKSNLLGSIVTSFLPTNDFTIQSEFDTTVSDFGELNGSN